MIERLPDQEESFDTQAVQAAERDIDAFAQSIANHLPPAIEAAENYQYRKEAAILDDSVVDALKERLNTERAIKHRFGRIGRAVYRWVISSGDSLGFTEFDKVVKARDAHSKKQK